MRHFKMILHLIKYSSVVGHHLRPWTSFCIHMEEKCKLNLNNNTSFLDSRLDYCERRKPFFQENHLNKRVPCHSIHWIFQCIKKSSPLNCNLIIWNNKIIKFNSHLRVNCRTKKYKRVKQKILISLWIF